MFQMIRTFHTVGQGAFYTEELINENNDLNFTMIYDCGSYGNKKIIIKKIKESGLKKDIDLLFISHFHDDHINGLEYLLKDYNIKRIVLPLLHEEEKIEIFLENYEASEFIQKFSLNPKATIQEYSKNTKLTFVSPVAGNNSDNYEAIGIKNIEDTIFSGVPIRIHNKIWQYVPFNFEFKKRSKTLMKELSNIGIDSKNFIDKYKTDKANIINIYKKIPGDLNTNSMTLYSNCISNRLGSLVENNKTSYMNEEAGCIYTGDYNLKGKRKWTQFKTVFNQYFDDTGIIQIPHHGSSHNYNEEFNFKSNLLSIISSGKTNKYRHPHCSTLKKIILKGGIPLIVTEDKNTEFIQKIKVFK